MRLFCFVDLINRKNCLDTAGILSHCPLSSIVHGAFLVPRTIANEGMMRQSQQQMKDRAQEIECLDLSLEFSVALPGAQNRL